MILTIWFAQLLLDIIAKALRVLSLMNFSTSEMSHVLHIPTIFLSARLSSKENNLSNSKPSSEMVKAVKFKLVRILTNLCTANGIRMNLTLPSTAKSEKSNTSSMIIVYTCSTPKETQQVTDLTQITANNLKSKKEPHSRQ